MPIGKYPDFAACVQANSDKSSPEGFCAWLEHNISGEWPGEKHSKFPDEVWTVYRQAYVQTMSAGDGDKAAHTAALKAIESTGWHMARGGYVHEFAGVQTRNLNNVVVFAVGEWTDAAGQTKKWTSKDLDRMVEAFASGVPLYVPAKAGHTSDEFNTQLAKSLNVPQSLVTGDMLGQGAIALGRMVKLRRSGNLLVADFADVPAAVADLIESGQFRSCSAEIEDKIGEFGPVISGVAFLGAELPAVDLATLARSAVFGAHRSGSTLYAFAASKYQEASMEGNMDGTMKKLCAALGLPEGSSEEDMMNAIAGLKQKAQTAEQASAESKAATEKFAAVDARVKTLEERNKGLERNERVRTYQAQTSTWNAIPGKPEELAKELADIEEQAGKPAAEKVASHYAKANEAAQVALKAKGTEQISDSGNHRDHEFAKKVQARADAKKITFQRALVELSNEDKTGFAAYRKAVEEA